MKKEITGLKPALWVSLATLVLPNILLNAKNPTDYSPRSVFKTEKYALRVIVLGLEIHLTNMLVNFYSYIPKSTKLE